MFDELFGLLEGETKKREQEKASKERELNRFLSDPSAFDSVSPAYLDRLHIITESEIAKLEDQIRENERDIAQVKADQDSNFIEAIAVDAAESENEEWLEDVSRRRLLLQLIAAEKARRSTIQPQQLTREQERQIKFAESQARVDRMKKDKLADINRMTTQGDDQASINRRENMWDDAIANEEVELRRWL